MRWARGAPGFAAPALDDGSDGFQKYCNGGASGNFVYFTLRALRQLGRLDEAQRIFIPMLRGYAEGGFEGVDPDIGQTFDWRDWSGQGWGYEGFLVDNYLPLLEVPEFAAARLRAGHSYSS